MCIRDRFNRRDAKTGGQNTIKSSGRPAALQVSQNRGPAFHPGPLFELPGDHLPDPAQPFRLAGRLINLRTAFRKSSLGGDDDTKFFPPGAPLHDLLNDYLIFEGQLGD